MKTASTVDPCVSFQLSTHSEQRPGQGTCAHDDQALRDVDDSAAKGCSNQVRLQYGDGISGGWGCCRRCERETETERERLTIRLRQSVSENTVQQPSTTVRSTTLSVHNAHVVTRAVDLPVRDQRCRRQRHRVRGSGFNRQHRARFPIEHPPVLTVPSVEGRPHTARQPTQFTNAKSKQLRRAASGAANNLSTRSVNIGGHFVYCAVLPARCASFISHKRLDILYTSQQTVSVSRLLVITLLTGFTASLYVQISPLRRQTHVASS